MHISLNPYTREIIARYELYSDTDIERTISQCNQAFKQLQKVNVKDRAQIFHQLTSILENRKIEFAVLITDEMGKPFAESVGEIEKCAWLCRHFSDPENITVEDELLHIDGQQTKLTYEPLGVIFAVMPWNFPFWQVLRFAVPNVAAGNTCVMKHAPNVSGCSLAIERLFLEAGFPKGTFSSLLIDIPQVEKVIGHRLIKGVTLTGSASAGKSVAQLAGRYAKKCVLELGGSDPLIVFADADIEKSCSTGVRSRMLNAGQVCIAAKRFIVHETIFERYVECFKDQTKLLRLGNPMLEATNIGPMARPDLVQQIEKQVNDSVSMGARVVLGAKRWEHHEGFYEPTILTDISADMPVFKEETFGPVAIFIPFTDTEEAIRIANSSLFGLGAGLWTSDMAKSDYVANRIEAGAVFVNSMVRSDPRLPFGGCKGSGYGRELHKAGMKEFMNLKTIQFST